MIIERFEPLHIYIAFGMLVFLGILIVLIVLGDSKNERKKAN